MGGKAAIEAMCEDTGIAPAKLAKRCLLSALTYYRKHNDVPMPPAIVRQSQAATIDGMKMGASGNPPHAPVSAPRNNDMTFADSLNPSRAPGRVKR